MTEIIFASERRIRVFILSAFLPVVLKSGVFRYGGRFSANLCRLFWLKVFSLLLMNGLSVFFTTIGNNSSANIADGRI